MANSVVIGLPGALPEVVSYETLDAKGDVGYLEGQLAKGDHVHPRNELGFAHAKIPAQSGSTSLPNNNNKPTTANGTQIFSKTLTLESADNVIHITGIMQGEVDGNGGDYGGLGVAVFRGSTCIGGGAAFYNTKDPGEGFGPLGFNIVDAPGTVGPHTYTVRVGTVNGTTWYVGRTRNVRWNGAMSDGSNVTLMEMSLI
jgi:hypothetical protein